MKKNRKIRKIITSKPTIEGAGVHLKRAFAFSEVPAFDPFLLLDDFRSNDPRHYLKGFPWHPHRGIETITYVLHGKVEHGDSMGNEGVIGPGDVQWMTAGSGIIHQEMPKGDKKGRMGGFQLWANLPASHKMMEPRYRDVKDKQIPEISAGDGVSIRIICGEVKGTKGPVRDIITEPQYLDVTIPAGTKFVHPTRQGHTVFAYIIEGRACFSRQKNPFAYDVKGRAKGLPLARGLYRRASTAEIDPLAKPVAPAAVEGTNYFDIQRKPFMANEDLVLFDDGEQIFVSTEDEPVRFLLMSGKPLGEPVAWYGPIVMNTQQELRTAFEEYRNGTFIKHKKA
jgi:redox-sensitive bicupin YhaK (pirin superfamily)